MLFAKNNFKNAAAMKKALFFIFGMIWIAAYAQQDTLHWNENEPRYYYWDSLWWNWHVIKYYEMHPEIQHETYHDLQSDYPDSTIFETFVLTLTRPWGRMEYARPLITDTALKIIGAAAPVDIRVLHGDADTALANRVTEYFRLYKYDRGQMVKLAEAPWDYVPPSQLRYAMATGHDYDIEGDYTVYPPHMYYELNEHILPVYEAYFSSPVIVTDTFFVSGTQYNNYRYADTIIRDMHVFDTVISRQEIVYTQAHPPTAYVTTGLLGLRGSYDEYYRNLFQTPSFYMMQSHSLDKDPDDPLSEGGSWERVDISRYHYAFLNMFPIIDTGFSCSSLVVTDTCATPSNLHITLNYNNTATIGWDYDGFSGHWEVLSYKEIDSAATATITTHTIPFVSIEDEDTTNWHVVRVRMMCDSAEYSQWSDTIRFRIKGGVGPDNPTNVESVVEALTYVMPNPASEQVNVYSSFGIVKIGLYSVSGKKYIEKDVKAMSMTMNVSSIPSGYYILRIQTNKGIVNKRLVIK